MKFIGRKFVALLLAVMMTLSLGVSANAAEPANYDDYIKVTDEIVESIVVEWAEYVSPGRSFDVSAIYDYYDQNDQLIGYSVSVTSNGIPYGYVLLDFFQENMISEFVIEENAVNICETALAELQSNTRANDLNSRNADMSSVKLHKCLPLTPAVSVEVGGTELYAIGDEVTSRNEYKSLSSSISVSEISQPTIANSIDNPPAIYDPNSENETTYGHCGDVMLRSIPTGYTAVDPDTRLNNPKSFSQSWAENNTGSYACAIVAALNIMYQNNCLLNNDSVKTYDWLWDETGTKETTSSKCRIACPKIKRRMELLSTVLCLGIFIITRSSIQPQTTPATAGRSPGRATSGLPQERRWSVICKAESKPTPTCSRRCPRLSQRERKDAFPSTASFSPAIRWRLPWKNGWRKCFPFWRTTRPCWRSRCPPPIKTHHKRRSRLWHRSCIPRL